MPPARKKRGAAAAAAAAAAAVAAQWNVGDLVLAKMKGFPPWPAMISEPQQWDLSPVRKKLLVYFYGTKEIAFCNYADLEAFTEEKKKSLLAKRHGKGADFVRAVKEIIEIYDSLKTENNDKSGLTQNNVGPDVENLINNSSSFDAGGPEDGSGLVNEIKMVDRPDSSMDHSMISTPGPNIVTVEGEHCVMNLAHGEPIEKLPVLDELPLHASSCSKKRQQDSCTYCNFTSPRRSKSSPGSELRTSQDSSGLTNGTNLPSVDLVPGDKREDVSRHKSIDDDKSNSCPPSTTKEVVLLHSSQGTCSQLGGSEVSNDDNKVSIATKNVQSTCSIDVPQTGGRDKEVKLNETHDLPMSTTLTFKRKRRPNTSRANNPVISGVTNMDSKLLPKSSENLADSPNSSNEINKSDGDEHLPLVKRARVRMERPILDNATVSGSDVSYNKIELVKHADQCYESAMSEPFGEDHSANGVPPGIDPSPKIDLSVPSKEVQTSCKNKEYQPKVLAMDVEAALPPSKRLHRALEAMSANVSEIISNLPEVTKSKEIILKGFTVAGPPSNNPAGTVVKSPKSAIATSPKVSLSAHSLDAPTGQKLSPAGTVVKSPKSAIATSPKVSLSAHSLDAPTGQKLNPVGTFVKSPKSAIATSPKVSLSAHSLDVPTGQKLNPAGSVVKSPKSAIATSPKVSLSAHSLDVRTGQKHTSGPIMLNKDAVSTVSPDLKNNVSDSPSKDKVSEETHMDDDNIPDLFVYSRMHDGICGKAPTYSMKLKKPALVSFDLPPSPKASVNEPVESIGGPTNGFGKNIDGSAEPVSQANAVVSDTSGSCNPEPHDATVLAEPMVNVCDRESALSLVSKVSCIHSDASTRTWEAYSSSVIAPEGLNHSLSLTDKSLSPDSTPMEELVLVADGHAHRFSRSNSFMEDSKVISESLLNKPSLKEGSSGRCSPSNRMMRSASDRVHSQQNNGKIPFDNLQSKGLNKLTGRSEANSARRAFEAFIGTLTRTKESISRATHLALECAKCGIAGEVMDIIIEHMEKETNLYKRVDLFFLVDSIIRYCRNQKGGPGDVYPSLIQAVLPRIIYASAPPGNSAWKNRRQCLKVLRLWLERKTLSEYIIRHHIKELEALNEASFGSSHHPSGTERALNDPLRDDESFLVDEYGSNAGFHLPGFISTKLLEDEEGRSSEERSFEAVTPGYEIPGASELDTSELQAAKHQLILEEVDGELEMEDAAPSSGAEASCTCHQDVSNASCTGNLNFVPPLPDDKPPSPPPLPSSPPSLPRPPCSASQGSHVQGALLVAADRVEQHRPGATYDVEGQHPYSVANNRGNMDACVANQYSSQPPVSYNSGYVGHTNQILPPPPPPPPPVSVAPFHPSGPHGNLCGPAVPHHGNSYHQPPSAPLPNNAYHLQPPPHPPAPNQFLYPPEPEQRTQPWNYNPPYPQRYQYGGHDRGHHEYDRRHHFDDRGHHFSDRAVRGQMHHEIIDGGKFPPYFPPGPPFPDHFEVPPTPFHCGRPSDPPPGPCSGWSMPHRRSKYPPAFRHSMEPQVSHGGGWRRHGRRDYD